MNNEIQRKLTSLTLMTIMVAGGMSFAIPGMEPANAATGDLHVSASEVGNFAGIQVIEIVVDDPARSDTSESQGIPNVEINGDDVLMAQADDGAWYGYVANDEAINDYEAAGNDILALYGGTALGGGFYSGSDSVETYGVATEFLDGFRDLSTPTNTGAVQASTTIDFGTALANAQSDATIVVGTVLTNVDSFSTITTTGQVTDTDTVVIGGETFTAEDDGSAAATAFEFDITGDAASDLTALADEINAESTFVTAVETGASEITITAIVGTSAAAGDAITTTVGGLTIDTPAATLGGGVDADTVTLNSVVYTAVLGAAGALEFEVIGGATGTATELASILDTSEALVTASSGGTTTVTITAVAAGTGGDGITLASSDDAGRLDLGAETATNGGVDADTITLNSIVYTAVASGALAASAEFDVDSDDNSVISMIAAIVALDTELVGSINTGDSTILDLTVVVGGAAGNDITITSSDDTRIDTTAFSGGSDSLSDGVDNNPAFDSSEWPFIQTFDISDNSDVTIKYGTGSTADSITILYDYDDDKDISLDRQKYPTDSYVFIDLDDSLLNLSPTGEDIWEFEQNGEVNYYISGTALSVPLIDFTAVGFEEGPFAFDTTPGVYILSDTDIGEDIGGGLLEITADAVLFRESNDNDNIFVNYDRSDESNLIVVTNGEASVSYNDAHSIIQDTFNGVIRYLVTVDEWLSGIELSVELVDEDRNLNSKNDESITILDGEVPYIAIGDALHLDDATVTLAGVYDETVKTDSEVYDMTVDGLGTSIEAVFDWPYQVNTQAEFVYTYASYDFTELGGGSGTFYLGTPDGIAVTADTLSEATFATDDVAGTFTITMTGLIADNAGQVYLDILSFGQEGDISDAGATIFTGDIEDNVDRVNDAYYRFELEETDDNTATFDGTVEYIMINQLNVFDEGTYDNIKTDGDEIVIIVNDDSDGADAIRISYNDLDSTDNDETISAQEDANTHSGSITLDKEGYTAGNTITVTLEDTDLNTNSDTIQTYDVASNQPWLGEDNVWLVQMLVNGELYDDTCNEGLGLEDTGLTLTETTDQSGIFVGTLKLPALYCVSDTESSTTNGLDVEFEYQDYADSSGKPNETSNTASIRSTTGSVNLDKTVYGVPIQANSFKTYDGLFLDATPTKLVIHVDDSDFNVSASGEDTLSADSITVEISRSGDKEEITDYESTLIETAPDAGIFELEVLIPQAEYFGEVGDTTESRYIHQGDIITITYTDESDASGSSNTVTDSATFDLRNGVLQSDKSVYVIGSTAIITLIEPDLNLDSETAETWSLGLVNWDSDAGEDDLSNDIFDAQPTGLRETGDDTGIFQVVIEIPVEFTDGDKLERGEEIDLEYTDYGPAGADYINDEDEEVNLFIYTSDFGATIELDQKVYSWTDKVYVTIVAPDHNFDSDKIDEIGIDDDSAINVSTREDEIENYKLVETGTDTGIFTGEVILTGFDSHDADGDGTPGEASGGLIESGPTGGQLPAGNDDGLTVSFEYSDGHTVIGSALIRWNIGEVQWLEASYPATASGVVRVIDNDMNFNPEAVDNFEIDVWSDTDAGGISLSVTETNEATGIFEGTVFFTISSASSGSRLNVNEGDTVTAEYEDNTLPDPYSTADELDVTATTLIGTLVPPLERAPAANLRAVDAFDNSLSSVQVDQQVQVTADLSNGQDRSQEFAYLLQVQNQDGVTVSLSWITGNLESGQSFSPSVSWIPGELGDYEATVFVWESIDNPTALSPPVSTTIQVS